MLNVKVEQALIKIDFIERFKALSETYNDERVPPNRRLEYFDGELIMDIISELGYLPIFNSKEKFFKIQEEKEGPFTFGVHLDFRYGICEIIWVVKEGKTLLLGTPWTIFPREMINPKYIIKYPRFETYEDLDEILKIVFLMYEDFKKALISIG